MLQLDPLACRLDGQRPWEGLRHAYITAREAEAIVKIDYAQSLLYKTYYYIVGRSASDSAGGAGIVNKYVQNCIFFVLRLTVTLDTTTVLQTNAYE